MKKVCIIFIFLICVCVPNIAIADDLGLGDSTPTVENAWYGQKQITDEEFEKTITKLKDKKKNTKKKFKGESLNKSEINDNNLGEFTDKNLLLTLPVELLTADGQEIPVGHYNIVGRKQKNKIYLDFRQSHTLVATVEAIETDNDFGESSINFVKIRPHDDKRVKVIYGSIDFNAVIFINLKNALN